MTFANSPAKPAIFDRPETIFGVCEALGDDFGVSAHWFRAALFGLTLWQPLAALAGYAALGLLVLASRLIFPDRRIPVAGPELSHPVQAFEPSSYEQRDEPVPLAA